MTDRFHQGVQELHEVPVPDQWDDIVARAAEPHPTVISLTDARRARRPRWPLMAAAAVVVMALAIAGAVRLGTASDPEVETGPVESGPDNPLTDSTTPTTTPPTTSSTTTGPDAGEGEGQGGGQGQEETGEQPEATNRPATDNRGEPIPDVCWETQLATSSGPADLPAVQGEAVPDDPRLILPNEYHLGTFTSDANTQRAVFVVIGPFAEDGGESLPHPLFGDIWLAGSDADGWLAELQLEVNGETCWIDLYATGLNRSEMVGFLDGLSLAD